MRRTIPLLLTLLLAVCTGTQSHASEEYTFESFQPIWTVNDISLSRVTIASYNSGEVAISAVVATCDSNRVMSDYGPVQRNAAFEVGLQAAVTFNPDREPPLFGDTLWVVLRATRPPNDLEDHSYATIVEATVQCILLNAAQSNAIRFVALKIEGSNLSSRYGGVYPIARLRNGPKQGVFKSY